MATVDFDNTLVSNYPEIKNPALLLIIKDVWEDLDYLIKMANEDFIEELEYYLPSTTHTSEYNSPYVIGYEEMVINLGVDEKSKREIIDALKVEIYVAFWSLWLTGECVYLDVAEYNSLDNFIADITMFDNVIDYLGFILKQY